jgi:large subunit ribosomal protein L15
VDPLDKEVTAEWLHENGLIRSTAEPIKILGDGECSKSIVVKAHSFSKSAREKIEKAKGKAEVVASA